jgi:colicin import membrane protein
MNRLQKKCMLVSGGIHLLLAVMLIFGPGFLSSHSHDNAPPLLKFVPGATVESIMSGGGDSSVKNSPAEATSPAPTPVVTPNPIVTPPVEVPQPPVERVQPRQQEKEPTPIPRDPPRVNTPTIDPKPIKPDSRKAKEINVDLTVKTSSAADLKAKQAKAAAAAVAAEQTRLKNIAAAFGKATTGIRNGVSDGVKVNVSPGPGGGGVAYGNIKSAIYTKYYDAWKVPNGAPNLTVWVSITLSRDGTVVTTRITKRSGDADLDESVQSALNRVRTIAPLPDGSEDPREFSFGFNPEMKSTE